MDQEHVSDKLHWHDEVPQVTLELHVIIYVLLLKQFSIYFQTNQMTFSSHIQIPPPLQEQIC